MSNVAISIEGIGKQYFIGGMQKSYDRIGEQLVDMFSSPVRRAGKLLRGHATGAAELDESIWALKDITFDIHPGEAVGIIGSNGAGKSTLLKILSRITDPTEGVVDIYGRVGSLLEVGTGFHPELTGRENIFLNGAILGMPRAEIAQKFDKIVNFAEIEKFIDTPVKHYSSGMYVRLAFSVAAHLEPEILLVDEVLAVGDAKFQRKSLGKMDDVAKQGRTVLFVSHNMALIQAFCERGIYLNEGKVAAIGPMEEVVTKYLKTLEQKETQSLSQRTDRKGKGDVKLTSVEIIDGDGVSGNPIRVGEPVRFSFNISELTKQDMWCRFTIKDEIGHRVVAFNSKMSGIDDTYSDTIGTKFICEIDELLLIPGRYRIDVSLYAAGGEEQDSVDAAIFLEVFPGEVRGRHLGFRQRKQTNVYFPHRWIKPELK
jgi:lipopolysaccharide transport system ATP-binding protein